MSDKPTEQYMNRLTPSVLAAYEKEVRKGVPLIPSTELEAGYALGIERALRVLREGFLA